MLFLKNDQFFFLKRKTSQPIMQFHTRRGSFRYPPDFNKMDLNQVLRNYVTIRLLYREISDPCECMYSRCRCSNQFPTLSWCQAREILPADFLEEGNRLHAFLNTLFVEQCVRQCTEYVKALFRGSKVDCSFAYSKIVEYCIGLQITVKDNESDLVVIPESSKLRHLINTFVPNYIYLSKGRMNPPDLIPSKPYIEVRFDEMIRGYQKQIRKFTRIDMLKMENDIQTILDEVREYNQGYDKIKTEIECSKRASDLIVQIVQEMENVITKVEKRIMTPFITRFCEGMDLRVENSNEYSEEDDY